MALPLLAQSGHRQHANVRFARRSFQTGRLLSHSGIPRTSRHAPEGSKVTVPSHGSDGTAPSDPPRWVIPLGFGNGPLCRPCLTAGCRRLASNRTRFEISNRAVWGAPAAIASAYRRLRRTGTTWPEFQFEGALTPRLHQAVAQLGEYRSRPRQRRKPHWLTFSSAATAQAARCGTTMVTLSPTEYWPNAGASTLSRPCSVSTKIDRDGPRKII